MAGGPIQLWNEWATQILILLSFTLQIFLFLFARTRRHGPSAVLRILLWLAYLMADSTAVYTLGHLSINGSPPEQKLTVFWAPFLLVHLGSQDTITAYALEDNQLWPRHLLILGVQASGVAYVLYKHIAEIPTFLRWATGLMFVVGVIKYCERIWALKCATLDNIPSSLKKSQALPTYYSALPSRGARAQERDEEELLLFAQGMLPICKGAMADFPVAFFSAFFREENDLIFNTFEWRWNWKATYKVVEMELSLMYDIIYTKTAVIHTWYGYLFHLVSPLATVTAFVLFQLSGNKDGYNRVDVAITYILLVGAFLMDMVSVFSALGSTWTCNFLLTKGWSRLGFVILCLRQHVKAARGNRRWSGSIGQFNLLRFCSRDRTKLNIRVAKMMGLEDWWNKWYYQNTIVISEEAKDLVFERVWHTVKEIHDPKAKDETQSRFCVEETMAMMPTKIDVAGFCPRSYQGIAARRMELAEALVFGDELQEMILTWHIFTDVFLSGTPEDKNPASSIYRKATRALSDYMVFLVAVCPNMVPGLELLGLYEVIRDDLDGLWLRNNRSKTRLNKTRTTLAHILRDKWDTYWAREVTKRRGPMYAKLLLELIDTGNPDKLGVISSYEDTDRAAMDKLKRLMPDLESSCRGGVFDTPKALALILDAWVRLLIFASIRCSRNTHARQVNRGSELMTIVWLMEEHAAMFRRPQLETFFESADWLKSDSSEDLESVDA